MGIFRRLYEDLHSRVLSSVFSFIFIGGIVLRAQQYGLPGATHNLIHEVGHILGLWHTHHGVSEMDCGDPCLEVEASLELGDLCSDTSPTYENKQCREPEVQHFNCAVEKKGTIDFRNYMGYASKL